MSCAMGAAVADRFGRQRQDPGRSTPAIPRYVVEVWKALSFGRFLIILFRGNAAGNKIAGKHRLARSVACAGGGRNGAGKSWRRWWGGADELFDKPMAKPG